MCGPLIIPTKSFDEVEVDFLACFHWCMGCGIPSDWQSITTFLPFRAEKDLLGSMIHFGVAF